MEHLPQFIYLALLLVSLGMSLQSHGEPRSDHNAFITLLSVALALWLLSWGGYFDGMF